MTGDRPDATVIALPSVVPGDNRQRHTDSGIMELIRRLRVLWRRCQLSGRDDFDRACLLIAGDETTTAERFAAAFFQGAQIYARCRLRFFNAKSAEVSDDEMWLARLLLSVHAEDYTSARYLMALRIAPEGRRRLMFLGEGLAGHLCAAQAGA